MSEVQKKDGQDQSKPPFTYNGLLKLFGIRPLPAAKHPESSK